MCMKRDDFYFSFGKQAINITLNITLLTTGTIREMTISNVLISLVWALVVNIYVYHHYTVYLIASAAGTFLVCVLWDINLLC